MAATVASITPASAPRQPAWAQPITPAAGSAISTGAQSAHTTPRAMPARLLTRASASTGWWPESFLRAVSTRALWTWRTVHNAAAGTPRRAMARARFSATSAGSSPLERPQLRDA